MKLLNFVIPGIVLTLLLVSNTRADNHLTQQEVKEQAAKLCLAEAEKKYGVGAVLDKDKARIIRDPSRAKWNKSLQGAMVKMKIKPQAKRANKYACLLKTDKSITFFKV